MKFHETHSSVVDIQTIRKYDLFQIKIRYPITVRVRDAIQGLGHKTPLLLPHHCITNTREHLLTFSD